MSSRKRKPPKVKAPIGRPTDYNPEIAAQICGRIADGESLRSICRDAAMPCTAAVFKWLAARAEFVEQYARAREAQADALADDILDIANTPVIGQKKKITEDGVEITEGDMIEHRRLQVDARKWIASKLKPKKYGDKLELGSDPNAPLQIQIVDPTRRGSNPASS